GIAAAFFASLERCSCVNVRTQHDELDDELRDSEARLIMFEVDGSGNAVAVAGDGAGAGGRRSGRGSWKSGTGKKSGGCGMGCYGD
uniref:Uncharacterized protein n=1 Tax=Oryza brachyantha TaxID=4533 RepID=J3LRJ5_ORYBR